VSRRQLQEALCQAGFTTASFTAYGNAQQCYKEGYGIWKSGSRQRIGRPTTAQWQALVRLYNQRYACSPFEIDAATLEAHLLESARFIRAYLHPKILSLNKVRADQPGDWQEALPATQSEPLIALIQNEEQALRQLQRSQINEVLSTALTRLEPSAQQLLVFYYQRGWTQQHIAEQLGLEQYMVSRQLSKAREHLLLTLLHWSQTEWQIEPTTRTGKQMAVLMDEWLRRFVLVSAPTREGAMPGLGNDAADEALESEWVSG
jgi:RNA polymerase sigma factor (sigma-70 family)